MGCGLIIIGSFLPWRLEGDFIPIWTNGIRISPSIKDNGGALLILLSLLVVWLAFQPPSKIKKPSLWILTLSSIIFVDIIIHLITVLIDHEAAKGIIGAPTIHIGLILVFIGSLIYLATSIYHLLNHQQ
jgi:hypothetical protein